MPIDPEDAKNTLFGGLKKSSTPKEQKPTTPKEKKLESAELPKWKTLEKVTVLLTSEQKDAMDELAKKIMRYRSQKGGVHEERERITSNSIFRALMDNFLAKVDSLDITALQNEEELGAWIHQLFRE
jgi:hypothetical protein